MEIRQEELKISRPQLDLKISNQGEVALKGDIASEDLQIILDNAYLKNRLYLEHQQMMDRENNLTAIYIGLILTLSIGLIAFCLLNQSSRQQPYTNLGEISNVYYG